MAALIVGKGSVGQAIFHRLKKSKATKKVAFFSNEKDVKNYDVLIGALPSEVAEKGLKLALKHKKDLIDVSALPISFYFKHRKEILEKGIKVIPGCGFSPGLVNLIVGFESQNFERINSIKISAGTLPKDNQLFFPFTWCFEDLIEQHLYPAKIIKNKKKISLPPFSGYKRERVKGVGEYESYFVEEWSTLFYSLKPKDIIFRVIRPIGFFHFFQYLKNYGFFKKENLSFTKKILTSKKTDNVTLALVEISGVKKKVIWKIFSEAERNEKLNSMQKITALLPVTILNLLSPNSRKGRGERRDLSLRSQNKIKNKGIIFIEEIAKDKRLFGAILKELKKEIEMSRKMSYY